MPTAFFAKYMVTTNNGEQETGRYVGNLIEYSCRDVWVDHVTSGFKTIARRIFRSTIGGEFQWYEQYRIAQTHHPKIHIEAATHMKPYPSIEYTIEQAIEKLHRKYPTVTFERSEERLPFNDVVVYGIKLSGDCSVIPAFYWSNLIMRIAQADQNPKARPDRPWKDVTQLFERGARTASLWGDKDEHIALWRSIVADGDQIPPWYHIATGTGPMSVRIHRQAVDQYIEEMDDGLKTRLDNLPI